MKIYTDENNRIKALYQTDDPSLAEHEIDETEFSSLTEIMLLGYCYREEDGVTEIYPAVDYGFLESVKEAEVYPEWAAGKAYSAGATIKYADGGETQLYAVMQAHTSQAGWLPPGTPALYKAVGFTEDGIPVWSQPQGAHDAYAIGSVVSHNGTTWTSTADNNVWEPGVYGWTADN